MHMQFKRLEIKPEGNRIKRIISSPHFKRSVIAILLGAVMGFGFYYFGEAKLLESMPGRDILKSMLMGGFFGFFLTNSPCARGRC